MPDETIGRISTCCSREQMGQLWSKRLWRQKVGTGSVLAIGAARGYSPLGNSAPMQFWPHFPYTECSVPQ